MPARGLKGPAGSFPCPKDVTGKRPGERPFLATRNLGTGECSVVYVGLSAGKDLAPLVEEPPKVVFDPEREAANAKRANSKAAKNLRLYIVANVLTRMWTLTYATAQWDRGRVAADVNDWLQRLRKELGTDFPAAYVIEKHPGGHGLHVHVALQSRYIEWGLMGRLWGHGVVQYSDGNKWVRAAKGKREQGRRLASYLAKYMAKAWADHHLPGDHRYEVTQGFGVKRERRVFRSLARAREWLDAVEGGTPVVHWSSDSLEDWRGPPAWVFVWV